MMVSLPITIYFCIAVTIAGSLGLHFRHILARLDVPQPSHREIPFGSLLFLFELLLGVGLAWHFVGFYGAVATFVVAKVVAMALLLALKQRVENFLLALQGILFVWAGWLLGQ